MVPRVVWIVLPKVIKYFGMPDVSRGCMKVNDRAQSIMGYPDVGSKIWLVQDEGNEVPCGHLSSLNEKPTVV